MLAEAKAIKAAASETRAGGGMVAENVREGTRLGDFRQRVELASVRNVWQLRKYELLLNCFGGLLSLRDGMLVNHLLAEFVFD